MEYSKPKFSVAVGSDAYRKGFDAIVWDDKPAPEAEAKEAEASTRRYPCALCSRLTCSAENELCDGCVVAAGP